MSNNDQSFEEKFQALNNTADTTSQYDPQDIEQNKVMAVLAYFGILVLIPLFAAKESKFARFHVNQGLILCIVGIIYAVVYNVLAAILLSISFRLMWLVGIINLVALIFLFWFVIGIINAIKGRAKELPFIGHYKVIKI